MLKVNIPLLCDKVPPGWQLCLTDNPGFGDARQHIEQIAVDSISTSIVYIYLLDVSNIGGIQAADFFWSLHQKDKGNYIRCCLSWLV